MIKSTWYICTHIFLFLVSSNTSAIRLIFLSSWIIQLIRPAHEVGLFLPKESINSIAEIYLICLEISFPFSFSSLDFSFPCNVPCGYTFSFTNQKNKHFGSQSFYGQSINFIAFICIEIKETSCTVFLYN